MKNEIVWCYPKVIFEIQKNKSLEYAWLLVVGWLVDQTNRKEWFILTDAAKEARREYMRKWREENRQSIREYNRNWRRANRDAMNQYAKNWRDANPEKTKGYRESYWERKAEQIGGAV